MPPPAAAPTAHLVVEVVDHRKVPPEISVAVGTTVAWNNRGAEWIRVAALDGGFDPGRIEPGSTFVHRFTRPGAWHYICENHAIAGTTGRIDAG